ncbi:uncharacterized protein BDW43DRAFT_316427 [Aspergillus alliaceus]|uniref:uncharacterized protein n=1 Tax=Petromyces alliaceus TaxID=209559 RepID=UPI0012A5AA6D|nr:uncharacterized protein BDW43DRAFT_316427 [Aspergillus alliaceus]KAB8227918.1 hypothetical protein BDW43DRAFT_316427 [Aspergillus alliaceus]
MPPQLLTAEDAVTKLIDSSKLIEMRPGLKTQEENRVVEAFTLLATGPPAEDTRAAKQRTIYLQFLQQVNTVLGRDKVVLCAATIGCSNVARMRDRARVELPHKMKERSAEFECGVLRSLGDIYFARFFPQRHDNLSQDLDETDATVTTTGDVYELDIGDIEQALRSREHIRGKAWLTDTYANTSSFITIPISDELTRRLIIQRRRVM